MKSTVQFFLLLLSFSLITSAPVIAQNNSLNTNWEEKEAYSHGYARVMQQQHFSFVNESGNLIHPVEFDGARNFSNHLAAVRIKDKWGFAR